MSMTRDQVHKEVLDEALNYLPCAAHSSARSKLAKKVSHALDELEQLERQTSRGKTFTEAAKFLNLDPAVRSSGYRSYCSALLAGCLMRCCSLLCFGIPRSILGARAVLGADCRTLGTLVRCQRRYSRSRSLHLVMCLVSQS